jgi:hypothetical protein
MTQGSCGGCRHFVAGAADLEREVPGLKILSSAFGSVRAETGLCRLRDFFCVPGHGCADWQQTDQAAICNCSGSSSR